LITLANLYQLQARDPEVIALLEKHRTRFSKSPKYLFTLAFSYYNRGNYSVARDLLTRVIALDPEVVQAHYLIANCFSSLGMPQEAVPEYEAAARISPNNWLYHFQLGMVLSLLQKKELAEAELKKSIDLNDRHAPAHYELAKIYFDTSRGELARQQLEEAIRVNPEFTSSYYLLSRVYAQLGQREKAMAMMKQFQTLQQEERQKERARKEAALGIQNQ
jgi:tetratricopeptide (TPR) repeat protein